MVVGIPYAQDGHAGPPCLLFTRHEPKTANAMVMAHMVQGDMGNQRNDRLRMVNDVITNTR